MKKIKDKRAPEPETPERRDVPVAHPDPQQGLTSAQVRERTDAGWTNAPVDPPGKTVKQIVLSNIFTYFNMLFFLLALCVIAVQQWLNLTFMGVIIVNTAIGIIQEIRSKKTLDKLNILASPKAVAVRDSKRVTVDTAQLVRDDIVILPPATRSMPTPSWRRTAATSTRRSSRASRMRSRKTPATSSCRAASSSAACAARS